MYLSLRLCAIIYNKGCVVKFKTSKEELLEFPEDVIDEIGYILYRVQTNQTHTKIKPLKGFNGVFEIRSNYQINNLSNGILKEFTIENLLTYLIKLGHNIEIMV
ncbi:MAG: hypothetical protein VKL60_06345, partial [Sphaerospermopsis sp.]|nr:hypothetical protein [Sphaerospermopsis sp.]